MLRLALLSVSIVLLAACAETPRIMTFEPDSAQDGVSWPVWPPAPEVPRFIYAGELVGEDNFVAAKGTVEDRGRDILAALKRPDAG